MYERPETTDSCVERIIAYLRPAAKSAQCEFSWGYAIACSLSAAIQRARTDSALKSGGIVLWRWGSGLIVVVSLRRRDKSSVGTFGTNLRAVLHDSRLLEVAAASREMFLSAVSDE